MRPSKKELLVNIIVMFTFESLFFYGERENEREKIIDR